jgi:predicted RNase H-like HicB family nuclease
MTRQHAKLLAEQLAGRNWSWGIDEFEEDGDVYFLVTIRELPDFFAAGASSMEAAANSRDALVSHLMAYLVAGKEIPVPQSRVSASTGRTVSSRALTLAYA